MIRESTATQSGDDMGHALTIAETARVEALLSLLDPDPGGTCQVIGCIHAHEGRTVRGDLPALAA
jgi:hypothetical protein